MDQLKQNCGQELANVDICVKTRDTPASMQYDNVAPMDYFSRLVTQFEQSMLEYRQAIQTAETHLQAVTSGLCQFLVNVLKFREHHFRIIWAVA